MVVGVIIMLPLAINQATQRNWRKGSQRREWHW